MRQNRDGLDDVGEPRLVDVEVTVTGLGPDDVKGTVDDVTLPTIVTNDDGEYLFSNLPDGTYTVQVTGGVPGGLEQTADPDGTNSTR